MFGLFKKDKSDDLEKFLNEADALYIKAFETRSIGLLKNHFTRECCINISKWIVAEASLRYFSSSKYRSTTWTKKSSNGSKITYIKTCIYKDIKINIARSMKVSDDYSEEWIIDTSNNEYKVASVTLLREELLYG